MNQPSSKNQANSSLSTILVIGLVALGLIGGWILMNSVTQKTTTFSQSGVTAEVPAGWFVNSGLQGEQLLFWTADQLDPNRRYIVSVLPAVPGGSLTDVVVSRNLDRSQSVSGYVVIDQSQVKIQNEDGYQVGFAYILPGGRGAMPRVIKGMDYFLPRGDKVLVITHEDEADTFDSSPGTFQRFLESVLFPVGG
jgi:hypothetical protein